MPKILVVDDEEPMRSLIYDVLECDDYEIVLADNVQEAYKHFHSVDLIITDLVMPDKNGLDLIIDFKKERPEIPIIAISGGGGINGRFEYLPITKLIGADLVMAKPFQAIELKEKVSELLAEHQLTETNTVN